MEKREEDLEQIKERAIASRYSSLKQFKKENEHRISTQDFEPGSLVLVRNKKAELIGGKTAPHYTGPMVVISRRKGGSYKLAESDGTVSKTRYAAFRLVPYYPRDPT